MPVTIAPSFMFSVDYSVASIKELNETNEELTKKILQLRHWTEVELDSLKQVLNNVVS